MRALTQRRYRVTDGSSLRSAQHHKTYRVDRTTMMTPRTSPVRPSSLLLGIEPSLHDGGPRIDPVEGEAGRQVPRVLALRPRLRASLRAHGCRHGICMPLVASEGGRRSGPRSAPARREADGREIGHTRRDRPSTDGYRHLRHKSQRLRQAGDRFSHRAGGEPQLGTLLHL